MEKRHTRKNWASSDDGVTLIAESNLISVMNAQGVADSFEVPYAPIFDEPAGIMFNATDACSKYLPPVTNLTCIFRSKLEIRLVQKFDKMVAFTGAHIDNPGHLFLVMRFFHTNEVKTPYISSLMDCICPNGTPREVGGAVVRVQALVCRALGCSYCVQPTDMGHWAIINPVNLLVDIIIASAASVFGPATRVSQTDYDKMARTLRRWHCPRFIHDKYPTDAATWNLQSPIKRFCLLTSL